MKGDVYYVPPPASGNRRLSALKHEERQTETERREKAERGEYCETLDFTGETHNFLLWEIRAHSCFWYRLDGNKARLRSD
jgi:hypothetical protein